MIVHRRSGAHRPRGGTVLVGVPNAALGRRAARTARVLPLLWPLLLAACADEGEAIPAGASPGLVDDAPAEPGVPVPPTDAVPPNADPVLADPAPPVDPSPVAAPLADPPGGGTSGADTDPVPSLAAPSSEPEPAGSPPAALPALDDPVPGPDSVFGAVVPPAAEVVPPAARQGRGTLARGAPPAAQQAPLRPEPHQEQARLRPDAARAAPAEPAHAVRPSPDRHARVVARIVDGDPRYWQIANNVHDGDGVSRIGVRAFTVVR